jgi:hypothetical protein
MALSPSDNLTSYNERLQASKDLGYGPSTDAGKLQEKYIAAVKSAKTNYGSGLHPFAATLLDNYATHLETLSRPENGYKGNLLSFAAYAQTQYDASGSVLDSDHIKAAQNTLFASQEFRNLSPLVFKGSDSVAPQARVYTPEEVQAQQAKASAQQTEQMRTAYLTVWYQTKTKQTGLMQYEKGMARHNGAKLTGFITPQEEAKIMMATAQEFASNHYNDPNALALIAPTIGRKFPGGTQALLALAPSGDNGSTASAGHGGPAGGGGFMNAAYNVMNGGSKGFGGMVKEYGQWGGALVGAIAGALFGNGGFLGIFIGALLGIAMGNGFKKQIGNFIDSKFPAKPRTPGGHSPSRGAGATLVSAPQVISQEQAKPLGVLVQGQENALLNVADDKGNLVAGVTHQKQLVMSNTGLPATIQYTLEKVGQTAAGVDKAQMRITGLSVDGVPVPDDKVKALGALPVNGKEVDLSSLSGMLESHTALGVIPGKVAAINDDITSGMTKEQKEEKLTGKEQTISFTYRHAVKNGAYVELPLTGELKQDASGSWSLTVSDPSKAIPSYHDVTGGKLPMDTTSILVDDKGKTTPLTINLTSGPTEGQSMEDFVKQNADNIRDGLKTHTTPKPETATGAGMLTAGHTPSAPAAGQATGRR